MCRKQIIFSHPGDDRETKTVQLKKSENTTQNIPHVMFVTAYTNQNSGHPLQEACGGLEVPAETSVRCQTGDKSTFSLGRVTGSQGSQDFEICLHPCSKQTDKKENQICLYNIWNKVIYETEEIQKKADKNKRI